MKVGRSQTRVRTVENKANVKTALLGEQAKQCKRPTPLTYSKLTLK